MDVAETQDALGPSSTFLCLPTSSDDSTTHRVEGSFEFAAFEALASRDQIDPKFSKQRPGSPQKTNINGIWSGLFRLKRSMVSKGIEGRVESQEIVADKNSSDEVSSNEKSQYHLETVSKAEPATRRISDLSTYSNARDIRLSLYFAWLI